MNAPQSSRRASAAVVVQSLLWLWLVCLSVFVFLGYQMMNDLADRERVDSGLQRLEAQVAGLTETAQALQQPASATVASLQETRQAIEERIAQIEQTLGDHAAKDALQVLRTEAEQIKARKAKIRTAAPVQPRSPNKATTSQPEPPPLSFRVVGTELRAGLHSVSIAPITGDVTIDQVQVLLPGDAVGPWRLQAIAGNTAVFLAGEQTRRVAIP